MQIIQQKIHAFKREEKNREHAKKRKETNNKQKNKYKINDVICKIKDKIKILRK